MSEFTIVGPADSIPPLETKSGDPATCNNRAQHEKDVRCDECGEVFPWGVRVDGTPKARPGRKLPGMEPASSRGRKTRRASSGTSRAARALTERSQASAEDLASSATDVLMTYDSWVKAGVRFMQLTVTADAMDDAKLELEARVHDALLMDPDLCRTILRSGAKTGKAALMVAFGTYALAIAPVAYMEFKMNRAANEE